MSGEILVRSPLLKTLIMDQLTELINQVRELEAELAKMEHSRDGWIDMANQWKELYLEAEILIKDLEELI